MPLSILGIVAVTVLVAVSVSVSFTVDADDRTWSAQRPIL